MSYYDEDEDRDEWEPVELPEARLDEPGKCVICGKPGCQFACFKCGEPVCYPTTYYPDSSECGGWILDSWHNAAPAENEFWCNICLEAGLKAEDQALEESGALPEGSEALPVDLGEELSLDELPF